MIPLWTTTVPSQSVWGWAFSSDGRPCVAQRVWPMPGVPARAAPSALEHLEPPGGPPDVEGAVVEHGDAGRVVAAILEALQPFDDDADRALVADVPQLMLLWAPRASWPCGPPSRP